MRSHVTGAGISSTGPTVGRFLRGSDARTSGRGQTSLAGATPPVRACARRCKSRTALGTLRGPPCHRGARPGWRPKKAVPAMRILVPDCRITFMTQGVIVAQMVAAPKPVTMTEISVVVVVEIVRTTKQTHRPQREKAATTPEATSTLGGAPPSRGPNRNNNRVPSRSTSRHSPDSKRAQ